MKALWIDLETTGLDPASCAIHECSVIAVANGGEWERTWNIKPFDGANFEEGWDVGDVSMSDVMSYTTTYEEFYRDFLKFISQFVNKYDREDKMFWLGYNAKFDNDFMRAMFKRHRNNFFGSYFWHPVLDVMSLAAFTLAPHRHSFPDFKQTTLYQHLFNEELEDAHDGLADIRACRRIFKELFPKLNLPV